MGHTPGPYRVRKMAKHFAIESEVNGRRIAEVGFITGPGLNSRHDAELLAAAPDMLAALKNLENDDGSIPQRTWDMVKAAIAKAEP